MGNPLEIRAGLTNVFANKNSAECQAWIEGRENGQAFEAAKAAIVANYNTNVKDDYEMNHQLEKYAVDETDDPDELVDHFFSVPEDTANSIGSTCAITSKRCASHFRYIRL